MGTDFFVKIFERIDFFLLNYIVLTVADVIAFVSPIFTSCMIVWIAIWGYMMMFGKVQEPLVDGFFRILRITAIMTLGLTVGTYMGVVVNFLQAGPEFIATSVVGGGGSLAVTLDGLFNKVFTVAQSAWQQGGIMNGNFGLYLLSVIVIFFGLALLIYAAFLVLLSKVMTTILLALGPIFGV